MTKNTKKDAYANAGVDIDQAEKALSRMKTHIVSTHTSKVLSSLKAFAGLLDVSFMKEFCQPILVPSTDGVGTKTMIAEMMDQWTVGQCIVNHCVNDILTIGAKPLCFMDYIASSKLSPKTMEKIIANMATACREAEIPLISGETAEMPGVYQENRHDIVGSIIGVVDRSRLIDGSEIADGDVLIGLPSNGLHTNGYSLARKAFFETRNLDAHTHVAEFGHTIGEELLKIHKCYFKMVYPLLDELGIEIHGIAHITGGGLIDNIARLLPEKLCAEISEKWKIPPVFQLIQEIEKVSKQEMRRVFNLGIGMVLIAQFKDFYSIKEILQSYRQECTLIGTIRKTRSKKEKRVFFTY